MPRVLSVAVLAAAAAAQPAFTAPRGHGAREGATSAVSLHFGFHGASRTQYLDGGQRGAPRANIDRARLRRDAESPSTATSGPRGLNAGFVLAHCDLVANPTPSATFAANYKTPPTQVYAVKPTNLPDHGPQPLTLPGPWDVTFPFDVPFSYNGTDDLLWEVTANGNTAPASNYLLDAVAGDATVGGGAGDWRFNGWTGCRVPPNASAFELLTAAPTTSAAGVASLSWLAQRGPANAPAVLALGLSDPNLVGLLCAPLRTSAELILPAGTTTASGGLGPVNVSFAAPVFPVHVFCQFAALGSTGLYLSDASQHLVVPYTPPAQLNVWRVQNGTSDTAPSGALPSRAAIPVVEFRHS
jgi:hypothetical protein